MEAARTANVTQEKTSVANDKASWNHSENMEAMSTDEEEVLTPPSAPKLRGQKLGKQLQSYPKQYSGCLFKFRMPRDKVQIKNLDSASKR